GHPTIREQDGLAMSSRNAYLSADQRNQALAIPRALSWAVDAFATAGLGAATIRKPVEKSLSEAGLRVDYVSLNDPDSLQPLADMAPLSGRALLAVAAFAGATR